MRIVDLAQRTPDWHRWRNGGITASEAAVILGRSPYQTRWQLWAQKTGLILPEDLSANPNIQRGIRLEPVARKAYEQKTGDLILPLCAESGSEPLFRASFDGINGAGEPVEFKCPALSTFEEVKQQREQSAPYQLYWVQVQHQLLVSGSDRGWLVFFFQDSGSEELIDFEIVRNDDFLDELRKSGRTFWQLIASRTEPDKDPDRDSFVPTGEVEFRWASLAKAYRTTHQQTAALEAQLKSLKQTMKATQEELSVLMGRYAHADYAGIKLCRYRVSGGLDYRSLVSDQLQQALDDLEPDVLERYRKPDSERWRLTVSQPKNGESLPAISDNSAAPHDLTEATNTPRSKPPIPGQVVNSFYF